MQEGERLSGQMKCFRHSFPCGLTASYLCHMVTDSFGGPNEYSYRACVPRFLGFVPLLHTSFFFLCKIQSDFFFFFDRLPMAAPQPSWEPLELIIVKILLGNWKHRELGVWCSSLAGCWQIDFITYLSAFLASVACDPSSHFLLQRNQAWGPWVEPLLQWEVHWKHL